MSARISSAGVAVPEVPYVELTFGSTALSLVDQDHLTTRTTEQALQSAVLTMRAFMIRETKDQIGKIKGELNPVNITSVLDSVNRLFMPQWRKMTLPFLAKSYAEGLRLAKSGQLPEPMMEEMAEEYAQRMGMYFHTTSREALIQGFNTYVNRRVPSRVAFARVIDAYGLTPRQISGLTSNASLETKVESSVSRSVKERITNYIAKSLHQRTDTFVKQETHNITMEAQQTAWMWMVKNNQLSELAEKVWLTAKDERVCPTCGPMNGKHVSVLDRFVIPDGQKLYVPGVHVNCRCRVRLVQGQKALIGKAERFDPREHPRDADGQFSRKTRAREYRVADRKPDEDFQRLLDQMFVEPVEEAEEKREIKAPREIKARREIVAPRQIQAPRGLQRRAIESTRIPISMREKREILSRTSRDITAEVKSILDRLPTPASPSPYRPTVIIGATERNPKGYPVYAVVGNEELDPHGNIYLTKDTYFTTDSSAAAFKAGEEVIERIGEAAASFNDNGGVIIDEVNDLHAYVDDWHALGAATYMAYEGRTADPDHTGNERLILNWLDEHGDPIGAPQPIDYEELAGLMGITKEDFDVKVLVMYEGHASSLGETHQLTRGASRENEVWVTTGRYVSEDLSQAIVGNDPPVQFRLIRPDVETQL